MRCHQKYVGVCQTQTASASFRGGQRQSSSPEARQTPETNTVICLMGGDKKPRDRDASAWRLEWPRGRVWSGRSRYRGRGTFNYGEAYRAGLRNQGIYPDYELEEIREYIQSPAPPALNLSVWRSEAAYFKRASGRHCADSLLRVSTESRCGCFRWSIMCLHT